MHVDCLGMPCLFKRNKKYGRVTDKETAFQVPYFSLQRGWIVMSYNKYCSMYDTKRSGARMRALRRALKSKEECAPCVELLKVRKNREEKHYRLRKRLALLV
jgi:hypothetical protein